MQQLANGIFLGSIYALFAMGYTLVFGILDLLNLAHQAVFMMGAFLSVWLFTSGGLPLWAAAIGGIAAGALLGLAIERLAFAPLRNRTDAHLAGLISSIALATVMMALALGIFGPGTRRFPSGTIPPIRVAVAGMTLSLVQVVILVTAVAMMSALTWLVRSTQLGRAMRAIAESPRAARVVGINVERVTMFTFMLSSALGAAAGTMFALAFNSIRVDMGLTVELKGLAVIIVGGMGSLPGAMLGGLALGLAEVFTVAQIGSGWRDVVAFGLLFAILLVWPRGLLGRKRVREV